MDVLSLNNRLLAQYTGFARSFTRICQDSSECVCVALKVITEPRWAISTVCLALREQLHGRLLNAFENRCTRKGTEGSNPSLSASAS